MWKVKGSFSFLREAFHYVQQRRFCINPNEGFVQQLIEYEPIYLANYQARTAGERLNQGGVKRSFEDESRDDAMDTWHKLCTVFRGVGLSKLLVISRGPSAFTTPSSLTLPISSRPPRRKAWQLRHQDLSFWLDQKKKAWKRSVKCTK